MRKPIIPALICSLLLLALSPRAGFAHYHHHYHHGGAALAWGVTGLVLGTTLAAFTYRPATTVVYAAPPPAYPPPAYGYRYAPAIPPGYCRWERYVLDGYGRTLLDGYGQPIKEYTIGSCQYPPN